MLEKVKLICEKQIEAYNDYERGLAPRLNLLDQWRAKHENSHSRVLAQLLNPKGSHKQGTLFLKAFLDKVGIKIEENCDLENTVVRREKGRIDITLHLKGKFFIILENKIDAEDQPNQIARYYSEVEKKVDPSIIHIIYLTKYGKEPSENSITKVKSTEKIEPINGIKCVSYKDDIISMLNESRKKLKTDSNTDNSMIESALIQYIDTLKGITKTRQGQTEMKKEMIHTIFEQFSYDSKLQQNIESLRLLEEAVQIARRTLCFIEVIEDWINNKFSQYEHELFLGIKEKHRKIETIKELEYKLLNENEIETFFLKLRINSSLLSIEFIPQLWKNNSVRIGILSIDNNDSINLSGKKIKDQSSNKGSIWDYVESYNRESFEDFEDIAKRVHAIMSKFTTDDIG